MFPWGALEIEIKNLVQKPLIVDGNATVADVAREIVDKGVGEAPVRVDGKLTGIVTEHDILNKVLVQCIDPCSIAVKDIMTSPLITIDASPDVEEAASMMVQHGIRRLPAFNDEELIEIITCVDVEIVEILQAMGKLEAQQASLATQNAPLVCYRASILTAVVEEAVGKEFVAKTFRHEFVGEGEVDCLMEMVPKES